MDPYRKIFSKGFKPDRDQGESCYDPYGRYRYRGKGGWPPNTDILETDHEILILLDLAGVKKEDIKVCHEGEMLQVTGVRMRKNIPGAKRFHRMEIDYGHFEKMFHLSPDLDIEKIKAEYRDGFLELSLPKKKSKELIKIVIVHEET